MRTRSNILAEVTVNHDYYANGRWEDVFLEVSRESRRHLEAMRLRYLQDAGRIRLVRDKTLFSGRKGLAKKPYLACFIRLLLKSRTNFFAHYTDVPRNSSLSEPLYFSNRDVLGGLSGPELSKEGIVSQTDTLQMVPKQFMLFPGAGVGKTVKILKYDSVVTVRMINDNGEVWIDMGHLPEGRYTVRIKGKEDQYIFTTNQNQDRCLAYIDLFIDPEKLTLDEHDRYTLNFSAREIFWRYNVYVGDRAMEELLVEAPGSSLTFEEITTTDQTENRLRSFISTQRIKCSERYEYSFRLIGGRNRSELCKRLPFPTHRYLLKHPNKEGEFLSEAFLSIDKSR